MNNPMSEHGDGWKPVLFGEQVLRATSSGPEMAQGILVAALSRPSGMRLGTSIRRVRGGALDGVRLPWRPRD